ncbi:GNAT family N-acetyltransferase [Paenibacillus sediminis]|uniref:Ribosomal protein S18 acetylase RimI-like enzyme n=1 Tax=Paenibacillus sediminis TaxID=664909 RepID=A0ABS4H2J9_9BACL|nr:GNAT family N-acetyltransferase [Paenibacillus sediminis]MBP1936487.1 ribosomal protein S18 acetylase RimI-like enzyme [Paenibacillus sediminis]
MLENVKAKIHDAVIKELLSYSVFPDPDRVDDIIKEYEKNPDLELYGYMDDGICVGVVGSVMRENNVLEIKHIAVLPENRLKGYGRGMIVELILQRKPDLVIAETDEDAVDFYRNIGFIISSLGEKYPGFERFRCEYNVNEAEE